MAKWWHVIHAKSEDEFDELWSEFKADNTILVSCKTYLWETWLRNTRKKFVEAWIDRLLHLGAVDSSPVEGAHRTLKCYIQHRNYDLRQT
jgi:hypothetical protein